MQESQLLSELVELWKERERLVTANNMMVNAYSDLVVRFRAYENLINRSWFLRIFLRLPRVEREIERIHQIEAELKGQADAQMVKRLREIASKVKVKKRQKQLDQILKHGSNTKPKDVTAAEDAQIDRS